MAILENRQCVEGVGFVRFEPLMHEAEDGYSYSVPYGERWEISLIVIPYPEISQCPTDAVCFCQPGQPDILLYLIQFEKVYENSFLQLPVQYVMNMAHSFEFRLPAPSMKVLYLFGRKRINA